MVLMADLSRLDKGKMGQILKNYEMEYSWPIFYRRRQNDTKTVVADLAVIDEKNMRLRHGVDKLAK